MYYFTSNERIAKYFENGGKTSFMIEDDRVLDKYNEIWNKNKKTLNIKFHSMPALRKNTKKLK